MKLNTKYPPTPRLSPSLFELRRTGQRAGERRNTNDGIYAVILAGGPGERFWPVSRIKNPKYTMKVMGSKSIIKQTVCRLKGLISNKNIFVVTTKDQMGIMRKELKNIIDFRNFLIEPCTRDTAAAIGLASIYVKKKNPEAITVVLPADHYIRNIKGFQSVIRNAAKVAQRNYLVTLGIKPTFPATGYGYIKSTKYKVQSAKYKAYKVERFVEKPDKKTAEKFLKSSRFFWNAGIFVWKVNTILDNIRRYMPGLYRSLLKIEKGKQTSEIYKKLKKASIDYGVMQKAKNRALVLAKFDWTDLGSWFSLHEIYKKDKDKNVYKGLNVSRDTSGSMIFGSEDHLIATSGIRNLVVIHTKDATLIADMGKAQEVKKLVELIHKKGLRKYI